MLWLMLQIVLSLIMVTNIFDISSISMVRGIETKLKTYLVNHMLCLKLWVVVMV